MVEPIVPPTVAKDVRKPEPTPSMVSTFPRPAVDLETNRVLMKKDAVDQVHTLDETRKTGLGNKRGSTGGDSSWDRIWQAVPEEVSETYRSYL